MQRNKFREDIISAIDCAIEHGLSQHTIEDILRQEEQNLRDNRRIYEVFVHECTHENCEESATRLVDQVELRCDICERQLKLSESVPADVGDSEVMKFSCEKHSTVRVHEFSHAEITCPVHNDRMGLIQSHAMTEELAHS